jgi:hypothetical protein
MDNDKEVDVADDIEASGVSFDLEDPDATRP